MYSRERAHYYNKVSAPTSRIFHFHSKLIHSTNLCYPREKI
nr:MAG TPA: hypothetical protein [Caudoviricetes sp.]